MPDRLENLPPNRAARPDLSGLNFLDLMKPEKRAPNATPLEVTPAPALDPNALTLERAKTIAANADKWTVYDLIKFTSKMSPSDKIVATRILQQKSAMTEESLTKLKTEVRQTVELKQWFDRNPGLSNKFQLNPEELFNAFGPKPIQEYWNFVQLMGRLGDPTCRIEESGQVDCQKVFRLAQSPLRQLPDHVLSDLLRSRHGFEHNLTSLPEKDIYRVVPALKGWAVNPDLSFESAERIGKLTPMERMAATVKLDRISKDAGNIEQIASSDKFFDELKKDIETNRAQILKSFSEKICTQGNMFFPILSISDLQEPRLQILMELMLPEQKPAIQKAIGKSLLALIRQNRADDPIAIVNQINPKIFEQLHNSDPASRNNKRGYDADLKTINFALLFKTEDQLAEFYKHRSAAEVAIVSHSMTFSNPKELEGLAEWLIKKDPNVETDLSESRVVEMWPHLSPKQRQLGRTELVKVANDVVRTLEFESLRDYYSFDLSNRKYTNFKAAFAAIDLFPDPQGQDRETLIKVSMSQPQVIETLKTLKAEQLQSALKGWAIDTAFPTEIATSVGLNKNVWEQAAAKLAWQEVSTRGGDQSKKIEMFPEVFKTIKADGKINVLIRLGDPELAAASMFPTIEPVYREILACACKDSAEGGNPVRKMVGIQCGAFRDVINSFHAESNGKSLAWHSRAALGLVSTFGKDWNQWLEKQSKKGVNTHDATFWLPQNSPKQNDGLKEWLFKNAERSNDKLRMVANRWVELSKEQRKLPFVELVDLVSSVKYLASRDENFAKENAKWSVNQQHYAEREKRYLVSRDTPSPFPLEKTWESGNLTGHFLPRNDPRGLYMGQHTGCCQHPDNLGSASAWHGQESPDGGFFVIVDKTGKIVAGSWAWVSDNGGLCFDSIESINVVGRERQVADIYKKASTDLAASKFHTVTTSSTGQFAWLSEHLPNCPEAKPSEALALPSNYMAYTDVTPQNQVVLAKNDLTPKRQDLEKQYWVRGATQSDSARISKLAKQIYPPEWRFVPEGNFEIVLETREHGPVGYAILDLETRQVNDLAVLETQRNKSPVLLRAVLKQIADVGGEWSCSARSSTSFELLKLAEKRGLIKILSTQPDGTMNGEPMFAITFTATSAAGETGNTPDSKPLERNDAKTKDNPRNPRPVEATPRPLDQTTKKKFTEKTVGELKKHIVSAVELLGSAQPDANKVSIASLSPESFGEVLESALTKMKNTDVSSDDLIHIEELQEALNRKHPEDLARLAALQAELAAKPTEAPLQIITQHALPEGNNQNLPPSRRPINPAPSFPGGSNLTIVVESAEKMAALEKNERTPKSAKEETAKSHDTKSGDTSKAKPKLKTAAKTAGSGAGVVVGIFTVLEAGLQGYEKLTNDKKE